LADEVREVAIRGESIRLGPAAQARRCRRLGRRGQGAARRRRGQRQRRGRHPPRPAARRRRHRRRRGRHRRGRGRDPGHPPGRPGLGAPPTPCPRRAASIAACSPRRPVSAIALVAATLASAAALPAAAPADDGTARRSTARSHGQRVVDVSPQGDLGRPQHRRGHGERRLRRQGDDRRRPVPQRHARDARAVGLRHDDRAPAARCTSTRGPSRASPPSS
jgi:hypothetical protein